jgi:tRNA (guanine6-N2)-methyltransferase
MSEPVLYVAEVIEGLEAIAQDEIKRRIDGSRIAESDKGEVQFSYGGNLSSLTNLKTIQAIYRLLRFPIPRPKALLGDQYFRQIVTTIGQIIASQSPASFRTLGIAAAGSDSSVMLRLRDTLAKAVGLTPADDKGDLLLRIRPDRKRKDWDVLVRITPRPLATRAWRVRNYEAALNATVAHALVLLTQPRSDDVFVNLCVGSGSIAIERALAGRTQSLLAVDNDASTLGLARVNFEAAGVVQPVRYLVLGDVKRLPLASASATALAADLPFGQRSGSHGDNARLYPALLSEAARITAVGAHFAVITHEVRLMDQLMPTFDTWELRKELMITLRGLHPRIYLFLRR